MVEHQMQLENAVWWYRWLSCRVNQIVHEIAIPHYLKRDQESEFLKGMEVAHLHDARVCEVVLEGLTVLLQGEEDANRRGRKFSAERLCVLATPVYRMLCKISDISMCDLEPHNLQSVLQSVRLKTRTSFAVKAAP